ncbi:hypothetical protein J433_07725 [Corynebacterium glutamicum MT]|nr:hypothetical protein C624_13845 [Corynebacterium glutamicum SCgG1]EGV41782.1 hypothetical protein CgS9114_00155 [Corynebacterium glutamicum S9114]EOA64653.1 hypothetical protein J433_07725 [Corynebacterium glutamicum MT]EPP39765.1 hypothetical protein A583_13384 [Corynebacterium glutamicum Z188]
MLPVVQFLRQAAQSQLQVLVLQVQMSLVSAHQVQAFQVFLFPVRQPHLLQAFLHREVLFQLPDQRHLHPEFRHLVSLLQEFLLPVLHFLYRALREQLELQELQVHHPNQLHPQNQYSKMQRNDLARMKLEMRRRNCR